VSINLCVNCVPFSLTIYNDDSSRWFTIGTWLEVEDWQAWLNSPDRKALVDQEKVLIDAPIKTTLLKPFEEPIRGEEQVEQEEVEAEEELEQI
jgi:hypothetical protein